MERTQVLAGVACSLAFIGAAAAQQPKPASPVAAVKPKELSLVRVNVTGQPYDYQRPWQKKAPFSKRALGTVLAKQ